MSYSAFDNFNFGTGFGVGLGADSFVHSATDYSDCVGK